MPFYQWSERMSVGNPLLDSDHKALIDLINRLHEALEADKAVDVLSGIFDSLIAYVEFHFAREEEVMEACAYPALAEHRAQHESFALDIRYKRDRYLRSEEVGIGRQLLEFLRAWLEHHIMIEDGDYRFYAQDSKAAIEAARRFGPGLSESGPSSDGASAAPIGGRL